MSAECKLAGSASQAMESDFQASFTHMHTHACTGTHTKCVHMRAHTHTSLSINNTGKHNFEVRKICICL